MALLKFLKGNYSSLNNAAIAEGQVLICGDTGEMFVDIAANKRIKIGDYITVANLGALEALDATAVPTSRLYYVEDGNILARSNGTTWVQINKQPTAEEMKTLLGLGSMAYKSEVAEGDLNADLKAKINTAADGNHAHANKGVLDGITAEKVAAWDAAEGNAKDHATGLNTAMNTRVEALEAIDHEHANKALLDTYTQTEANLADAVAKKHSHTFVESELNKIVAGDVAKWNGVVADHLTSADKTALEDAIGDVNTALEGEVTRAKEAEQANAADITGIKNGTSINNFAGVETELAKKVDKVEGKSLIADTEIARLATLANYDDTTIKADIAKKADNDAMTTALAGKVDKADGKDLIATSEIERLATLHNYDDTALAGRVTTAEGKITALETASATHALKTDVEAVDAKFANYKTAEAQKAIDDEQDRRIKAIEDDYLVEADIANFETKDNVKKVADDLAAYVESNDKALADVKVIAEAARTEDEVNSQIDAKITALNLATTYEPIGAETRAKAYADDLIADANLDQYTTEQEVKDIVDGVIAGAVDGDTITGLANLVEYINNHGGEAAEMGAAIDVLEGKVEVIEGKPAYGITASQISNWDGEVGAKALAETKLDASVFTEYSNAHAGDYTNKQIDDAIDADVKAAIDAEVIRANGAYDTAGSAAAAQSAAEATAAAALATARTEITAEIDADVKALADGAVATNAANIADIMEILTWGSF